MSKETSCIIKHVSVVAPLYNEERVLSEFLKRLQTVTSTLIHAYLFEFIFVDDGSTDKTLQNAKILLKNEPRLRVIELRRNYGQTAAIQAGIDAAQGDYIITMDADLQHFPEEIPVFLKEIEAGYDVVCGWRHDRQEGIIRRWPSKIANILIRKASGLTIHDVGTTYRAYRKEIVRDIQLLGENHRFVPVFARKVGARITEVKIENIERPVGQSNYGIGRTLNVFLDLFFIYFYTNYFDRPIRIFGKIALTLFSLAGIIILILAVIAMITHAPVVRERSGWVILSVLFILSGVQSLLTGIISEVLARIYYSPGSTHAAYRIRKEWNNDFLSEV